MKPLDPADPRGPFLLAVVEDASQRRMGRRDRCLNGTERDHHYRGDSPLTPSGWCVACLGDDDYDMHTEVAEANLAEAQRRLDESQLRAAAEAKAAAEEQIAEGPGSKRQARLILTKAGKPALWEQGGANTSSGAALLLAEADGAMPRAIFIATRGQLACGEHALVPLTVGMLLVQANQRHGVYRSTIDRIVAIRRDGAGFTMADLERVARRGSDDAWDGVVTEAMKNADRMARQKAGSYHCRQAVYVIGAW